MKKTIDPSLPTIGILIFEGFLTNEMVGPLDVFTKKDKTDHSLFNVLLIAKEDKPCTSEEGLQVLPDCTIYTAPKLTVLIVPSSNNPEDQTGDKDLIRFIQEQNKTTEYIASHCAGAFMLGEAGVANGKQIVTYCSGGDALQEQYPELLVQDDKKVSIVKDGKIISSNGNLVSYIASLDLLEEMAGVEQRMLVEDTLLLNRLRK